jgi:hypothetical protein
VLDGVGVLGVPEAIVTLLLLLLRDLGVDVVLLLALLLELLRLCVGKEGVDEGREVGYGVVARFLKAIDSHLSQGVEGFRVAVLGEGTVVGIDSLGILLQLHVRITLTVEGPAVIDRGAGALVSSTAINWHGGAHHTRIPRDKLVVGKHPPPDLDGLGTGVDALLIILLLHIDGC